MTVGATYSYIEDVPVRILSVRPTVERRVTHVPFEVAPTRTYGVARGAKGIQIEVFLRDDDENAVALIDRLANLGHGPIYLDDQQRGLYSGFYIPGDLGGEDKTFATSNFRFTLPLWEFEGGLTSNAVFYYESNAFFADSTADGISFLVGTAGQTSGYIKFRNLTTGSYESQTAPKYVFPAKGPRLMGTAEAWDANGYVSNTPLAPGDEGFGAYQTSDEAEA